MDSERDSRSEQGAPLPGFGEAAPHDRDRTDQRQTGQGQADPHCDDSRARHWPGAEHARSIGASEEPVGRRLGTHRRCGALTGTLPPRRDIPPLPPVRAASDSAAYGASGQA